jgi:ABC-type methionine transport system permease subunit
MADIAVKHYLAALVALVVVVFVAVYLSWLVGLYYSLLLLVLKKKKKKWMGLRVSLLNEMWE